MVLLLTSLATGQSPTPGLLDEQAASQPREEQQRREQPEREAPRREHAGPPPGPAMPGFALPFRLAAAAGAGAAGYTVGAAPLLVFEGFTLALPLGAFFPEVYPFFTPTGFGTPLGDAYIADSSSGRSSPA